MQVVINVPDEEYEAIKNCTRCTNWFAFLIKKGTPLSKGHGKLVDKKKLGLTDFERADIIEKAIKLLPPVQPQPKTGHWIEQIDHEENCRTLICSNCDRPALHDGDSIWKHKFCLIAVQGWLSHRKVRKQMQTFRQKLLLSVRNLTPNNKHFINFISFLYLHY